MKITRFETFLANAGLRNYLFVRLTADGGLTGVGEATLEWQERTVETILHEWVESRVLGRDVFDIEAVIGGMTRDQYQGGSTVMTAISGVEIAKDNNRAHGKDEDVGAESFYRGNEFYYRYLKEVTSH